MTRLWSPSGANPPSSLSDGSQLEGSTFASQPLESTFVSQLWALIEASPLWVRIDVTPPSEWIGGSRLEESNDANLHEALIYANQPWQSSAETPP